MILLRKMLNLLLINIIINLFIFLIFNLNSKRTSYMGEKEIF